MLFFSAVLGQPVQILFLSVSFRFFVVVVFFFFPRVFPVITEVPSACHDASEYFSLMPLSVINSGRVVRALSSRG